MKQILVLFYFLTVPQLIMAQQEDPVHWQYSSKKMDDRTAEIHLTASLNPGWHIYSQTQHKDAIAVPTKIVFTKSPLLALAGNPKEVGKLEKYVLKELGVTNLQYDGKVDFVQRVQLTSAAKTKLTGTITYQVCTEERCLPEKTVSFSIPVP